jgi:hypothetical protein
LRGLLINALFHGTLGSFACPLLESISKTLCLDWCRGGDQPDYRQNARECETVLHRFNPPESAPIGEQDSERSFRKA